jgi:hypothetical protein
MADRLTEDSRSVLEICQLVKGMPLAIELAVRWLNALSPAEIAQEIRRSMDILATQSRSLPERHRSIRAVFDRSWLLLTHDACAIFQNLSVFRGGFTREAAGASIQPPLRRSFPKPLSEWVYARQPHPSVTAPRNEKRIEGCVFLAW